MIDVDRMESQLHSATRGRERIAKPPPTARTRAPAARPSRSGAARVLARLRVAVESPAPADLAATPSAPLRARSRLVELVDAGDLVGADRLMDDLPDRRERVSWATMRALLVGREGTAREENSVMRSLAQDDRDREALDRYWMQRVGVVELWGTEEERDDLAEHCRNRAYRADDLEWTAALALLMAREGRDEEAREAFEDAFGRLGRADESIQLDVATNLVETAAVLKDALLSARIHYSVVWIPGRLVTVGEGWLCKGAVERFRALGEAAVGMFAEADQDFALAVARHRALGAQPLLARTLHQWGTTFVGRDEALAAECFHEADAIARKLGLTDPGLRLVRRD